LLCADALAPEIRSKRKRQNILTVWGFCTNKFKQFLADTINKRGNGYLNAMCVW